MRGNQRERREDSKQSGVSFKSGRSKFHKYFKKKKSSRVRLKKSLSSDIISVSVKRNNSQGCTADVKETPPSPEEKQEDVIGPFLDSVGHDEDLVESSDDQMAWGSMESLESNDSGVSFKSDQSKDGLINFKDSSPPSGSDFSSSEEEHVVADDEGFFESSDDLMGPSSVESFDSGVSFKSDRSKHGLINFKDRVSLRSDLFSLEEEDVVADDEDLVESSDDLGRDDPGTLV